MATVTNIDPLARPFLSSSPTNGLESARENWLATNPYDLRYGDEHFYDYKMNGWEPSSFPIPRFMSEYGVQSLPSFASLADVYSMPGDADMFGKLNEHRQHHGDGNQQIVNEIQNNLRLPISLNRTEYFKHLIYLSQINQAMHLRTGSELFRRSRSFYDNKTGNGLCSGNMYWQFNDLWQAPTWSSIEYVSNEFVKGGKWKMAHYFVKKAYTSFLISPVFTDLTLDIYAVSDLTTVLQSSFTLRFYSYSSLEPVFVQKYEFNANPLTAEIIFSMSLANIEKQTGCSRRLFNESCILTVEWTDPKNMDTSETNFLFFNNKLAEVATLRVPDLRVESVSEVDNADNLFEIVIETDQLALFTWLDVATSRFVGTFSDNGFHMTEATRTVLYQVESEAKVSVEDFKSNLTVLSLANLYA
jgi:beta-mannosidase